MIRRFFGLILVPVALLTGCFDERAPAGYEAVAAQNAAQTHSQCPDLTGTFDLSTLPLGQAITDQAPPVSKGLPVLMTFKQGPTNIEAWWVVPMDSIRQWAAQEREQNGRSYSSWRELALQRPGPMAPAKDIQSFRDAVAKLGPPSGPFYAGIVSYRCSENWARIREQPGFRGTVKNPDGEGFGDTEIWLGRDASGNLLVKTLSINLKPIHVWGDSANTIQTSSSAAWSKVEASEYVDPILLSERDLPPSLPAEPLPSCDELVAQLADLSNRIVSTAPKGVYLIDSQVPSLDATFAPACGGRGKVLELLFTADDPDKLLLIDRKILSESAVRSVTLLRKADDKPTERRLRIVLK